MTNIEPICREYRYDPIDLEVCIVYEYDTRDHAKEACDNFDSLATHYVNANPKVFSDKLCIQKSLKDQFFYLILGFTYNYSCDLLIQIMDDIMGYKGDYHE